MKKFHAFALGCVLGTGLALAPSCTPKDCSPATCTGCCTSDGRCATGETGASCGRGGSVCTQCTGMQACVGGVCSLSTGGGAGGGSGGGGTNGGGAAGGGTGGGPLTTCSAASCAGGCCIGNQCITGAAQSELQCGAGGFACLMCVAGNTCQGSTCTGPATCNASSCPLGCCNQNACLRTGLQSNGACGTAGVACAACPSGQQCNAGVCQAAAAIGSSCSQDQECTPLGVGAYCKQTTSSRNAAYPGGYCTVPCTTAGSMCAGGTGTCIGGGNSILSVYGEAAMFCGASCPLGGSQSTCRGGYACYGSTTGFCWLNPVPAFDGGGTPDKLGSACTLNTQCINPPGPEWGFCIKPTLPDGGASRFSGGYCVAECTYDTRFCGQQGACFDFTDPLTPQQAFYMCLKTCPSPGGGRTGLRPGYTCRTETRPDGGMVGYTWPACDSLAGADFCDGGFFCDATSGYCCDGGSCQR